MQDRVEIGLVGARHKVHKIAGKLCGILVIFFKGLTKHSKVRDPFTYGIQVNREVLPVFGTRAKVIISLAGI